MQLFATILALVAVSANGQTITNPTAASACITDLTAGFKSASTTCGATLEYSSMNVTGAVTTDPVAYATYLDKVCSSTCINAVGKVLKDTTTNCKSYPYGTNSTLADWNLVNYAYNFKFSCLKQASEYCLVKQIKSTAAAGKTYPNGMLLASNRQDLCVPCLKTQTDLSVEYYTENMKAAGYGADMIKMNTDGLKMLYNSCPSSNVTSNDAITNVQLFDFKASSSTKFAVSGLVAVLFAATLLA